MSEGKYSLSGNPRIHTAIVGALVLVTGYYLYQQSGHGLPGMSGKMDQMRACVDKLKLRLDYPAETDFHELAGADVSRGDIMLRFSTTDDSGETIEYTVLCQGNGGVHIL